MKLAIDGGRQAVSKPIHDGWKDIEANEVESVAQYLADQPISVVDGGILEAFEQQYAEFVGSRYAVAFCNGTAALFSALFACNVDKRSSVLMPVYGFHGIASAVLERGARVCLCDIDERTLTISVEAINKALTSSTRVILALHTWGNPAQLEAISSIARQHGVAVISDASHAHGATWDGALIGGTAFEDVACFSMGLGKLISGGELGIATTNNSQIRDSLILQGHTNRVPRALHTDLYRDLPNSIGLKFRPHPLALVIASSQLRRFHLRREGNVQINGEISRRIDKLPGFAATGSFNQAGRVYWRLTMMMDASAWYPVRLSQVVDALRAEGVPLQDNHYLPLLKDNALWNWPVYRGRVRSKATPIADRVNPSVLTLPGFSDISRRDIESIVSAFEKVWDLRARLRIH